MLLPGLHDGAIGRGDGLHQRAGAEQVTGRWELANVAAPGLAHGSPETMKASDIHIKWGNEVVERLRGRIWVPG